MPIFTKYPNRKYMKNAKLEKEVTKMMTTAINPEVARRAEARGIEKGIERGVARGIEKTKLEHIDALLKVLDDETIASTLKVDLKLVQERRA